MQIESLTHTVIAFIKITAHTFYMDNLLLFRYVDLNAYTEFTLT